MVHIAIERLASSPDNWLGHGLHANLLAKVSVVGLGIR